MAKKAEKVETPEVTPEAKIIEINKDIKSLQKKKVAFVEVKSEEEYSKLNEFMVEVKSRINRIKELVEMFNEPHKEARRKALEAMKKNEDFFGGALAEYEAIEREGKGVMSAFRLAENQRIKKEEEEAAKKLKEQQDEDARLAKEAKAKGETAPVSTVSVAPMPSIVRSAPTVKTEKGSSTAKNVIKFEILNHNDLPKKYKDLILEEAYARGITRTIIDKVVKIEGLKTNITGVRVYEDVDISIKA